MSSSPILDIKNASIAYGQNVVVPELNLSVEPGEFIVLLGPSGCGKSTLLSAIAGLTDLHDGQIWIRDNNVTWAEPKDRGIGMVFQSYALYPRMTVEQNLSFGLKVAGTPKAEIARKVADAARILQLEPLMKRRPSDLSGGQRQRVAIGRALVRDVDIFLFDEPLSNLDAKLRMELRIEIKRLHEDLQRTMVYVTHDQIEAMTLADRIVVMKAGHIQQVGTPSEVYNTPANLFVANFVGSPSMNLLDGTLSGEALTLSDGSAHAMAGYPLSDGAGGKVLLGLRPEQLFVLEGDLPAGANRLEAKIDMCEELGPNSIIWCEIAGKRCSFSVPGAVHYPSGSTVPLYYYPGTASLFSQETEQRL
ncbi:ABC transporter ATP-binding protein [Pseudooceanicola marinus]|uniref:ABC transporter ATP-binding protein n=1 Tax=Pseudooceanicola marinus TaxID=396013 RepID=UPI001CD3C1E4|nr:sn-glycerol-3-phosphate ABC transporter ATP-binding protein UgpC [Pseudooceanicola marinus]MCA1338060.1 sn-glycerol-3-phosphate ABC transporter ATP-binding protein UgpC [Pseudooceanicola marinus]